jgi:hypothetical protein
LAGLDSCFDGSYVVGAEYVDEAIARSLDELRVYPGVDPRPESSEGGVDGSAIDKCEELIVVNLAI